MPCHLVWQAVGTKVLQRWNFRHDTFSAATMTTQEKSDVDPQLTPTLAAARDDLIRLARSAAELQREHGLPVEPDEYVASAPPFAHGVYSSTC